MKSSSVSVIVTVPAVTNEITSNVIEVVDEQPSAFETVTSTTAPSVSRFVVKVLPETSPSCGANPSSVNA